jgi:hypothetical protein
MHVDKGTGVVRALLHRGCEILLLIVDLRYYAQDMQRMQATRRTAFHLAMRNPSLLPSHVSETRGKTPSLNPLTKKGWNNSAVRESHSTLLAPRRLLLLGLRLPRSGEH